MISLTRIVFCFSALILMLLAANADPLTTMDEVAAALMSCWKPPAGVEKSTVTLSFSLKSDGSLIDPPQSTFINVAGDEKARQQFVAAAMDAVDRCTPVELSPALAEGRRDRGTAVQDGFASSDKAQTLTPSN